MASEDTDQCGPDHILQRYLVGNRLSLYHHPDGADIFLQMFRECRLELANLQSLRFGTNSPESMLSEALSGVSHLHSLRELIVQGGFVPERSAIVGSLVCLPNDIFSNLCHLTYLDLSFNQLVSLPSSLQRLSSLSILILSRNRLQELPEWLGQLRSLTFLVVMDNRLRFLSPRLLEGLSAMRHLNLSCNQLESLPEELGSLHCLEHLDASRNKLTSLPDSLSGMIALKALWLHDNRLLTVPASLAALPKLSRLNLRNNNLRFVPPEVEQLCSRYLKGNPIGNPETPPLPEKDIDVPKMRNIKLDSDHSSMMVGRSGLVAWLPCGVMLRFPVGAVDEETEVNCHVLPPELAIVRLYDHELLLSSILVLQPHGIAFGKEVNITLPYEVQDEDKWEVVIRTFDCTNWSNLETKRINRDKKGRGMARCSVQHFSYFLVVARLVEDSCSVPPEGTQLFSTLDSGIRLVFPSGAVDELRRVRMQVLPVDNDQIHDALGDDTVTSPVLILSQHPASAFLKPVQIRLPLPSGVSGLELGCNELYRSKLHVLHGDPVTGDWEDITRDLSLQFTALYAMFEVSEFSLYWLWYRTKDCVGSTAKSLYERLRRWRVCFLAMQRKRDPQQVVLQCLLYKKVDPAVKSLSKRYFGPQPSDVVDILEGEHFYAAFEAGIELLTDVPKSSNGRLEFVFFATHKNIREVHVKVEDNRKQQYPVRGQVSFYRGELPTDLPKEAAGHRKGPDSMWLSTLTLNLSKPKERKANGGTNGSERTSEQRSRQSVSFPPLNLGNPESGYLTEANLRTIASQIGAEWQQIGNHLGLSYSQLVHIKHNYSDNLNDQIMAMLMTWARGTGDRGGDAVDHLITVLKNCGRTDLSEDVDKTVKLGREKYQEQLNCSNL